MKNGGRTIRARGYLKIHERKYGWTIDTGPDRIFDEKSEVDLFLIRSDELIKESDS